MLGGLSPWRALYQNLLLNYKFFTCISESKNLNANCHFLFVILSKKETSYNYSWLFQVENVKAGLPLDHDQDEYNKRDAE